MNDRETAWSRGFGFVNFDNEQLMSDEEMNSQNLEGWTISANKAHFRDGGGGGGGRGYGGGRHEGGGSGYGGVRPEGGGYNRVVVNTVMVVDMDMVLIGGMMTVDPATPMGLMVVDGGVRF